MFFELMQIKTQSKKNYFTIVLQCEVGASKKNIDFEQ